MPRKHKYPSNCFDPHKELIKRTHNTNSKTGLSDLHLKPKSRRATA